MKPYRCSVTRANALRPDAGWFWCLTSDELGPIMTGTKSTRLQAWIEVAYWARCFFPQSAKGGAR